MARWVAYYSILMGVLQTGTWIVLYFVGTVRNYYSSKPFETIFLIIAELLTAGAVILGGSGVLAGQKWGIPLNLAGLGMMLYCAIFSFGSFGQTRNTPAAVWFALLTIATVISILALLAPWQQKQPA